MMESLAAVHESEVGLSVTSDLAEELRSRKLQGACDALHDRVLLAQGSRAIVSRQPAWHAG
jgi:hypothetical protein